MRGGRRNPIGAGRTLCVVVVLDEHGAKVRDRRCFDRGADAVEWSRVREAGLCVLKKTTAACSAFYSSGQEPTDAEVVEAVKLQLRQLLSGGA